MDNIHSNEPHGARASRNGSVRDRSTSTAPELAVVLLMSANPDQQQPLDLDQERRQIRRAVRLGNAEDRLRIHAADALRLDDLQEELLHHRPAIAHFSGHGSASDGIVVTGESGEAQTVDPDALRNLFGLLRRDLRCVVLNACFTEAQATAIAAHIPYVIGMHGRPLDNTAVKFAVGFYRAVAHGETIRSAFELGRNNLELHGDAGVDTPRLIVAQGAPDITLVDRRPRREPTRRPQTVRQEVVDAHGTLTGISIDDAERMPDAAVHQNIERVHFDANVVGVRINQLRNG